MPHVVKLSDELVAAARETAAFANRSMAAQIEHWAALGKAIEGALTSRQASDLVRSVRDPGGSYRTDLTPLPVALAQALREALAPSGREALAKELADSPHPRYGTDPALPGYLIRHSPDGTRTVGRWQNGDFQALASTAAPVSATNHKRRRARA